MFLLPNLGKCFIVYDLTTTINATPSDSSDLIPPLSTPLYPTSIHPFHSSYIHIVNAEPNPTNRNARQDIWYSTTQEPCPKPGTKKTELATTG